MNEASSDDPFPLPRSLYSGVEYRIAPVLRRPRHIIDVNPGCSSWYLKTLLCVRYQILCPRAGSRIMSAPTGSLWNDVLMAEQGGRPRILKVVEIISKHGAMVVKQHQRRRINRMLYSIAFGRTSHKLSSLTGSVILKSSVGQLCIVQQYHKVLQYQRVQLLSRIDYNHQWRLPCDDLLTGRQGILCCNLKLDRVYKQSAVDTGTLQDAPVSNKVLLQRRNIE